MDEHNFLREIVEEQEAGLRAGALIIGAVGVMLIGLLLFSIFKIFF